MARRELILLMLILALGAFFRFYLIREIPPGLYPDEATNGNNAVEAIRNFDISTFRGGFKVFYPENNGREGLFINMQAVAIRALGAEPWVLRVVSAFFGTLTILGIYLLAKEMFRTNFQFSIFNSQSIINDQFSNRFENWKLKIKNSQVALFSAFFLATSYWHINFSRIGFRAILVPFFAAFGMYFLLKGLRQGKILELFIAGLLIGLGFHTYIAFRFIPFVLLVPLAIYLWRWKKAVSNYCVPCALLIFLLGAILAALPLGIYFAQHPDDFLGRSGQVSIFAGENPFYEFAKSNALTLQMFFWKGDCNPRHNFACQPQLFWPVAVFFIIGIAIAARNALLKTLKTTSGHGSPRSGESEESWRVQKSSLGIFERFSKVETELLLLAWFFFMLFPATLTREGLPHALRSIGLIPPVFLLAGWGAMYLWEKIKSYLDGAYDDPRWTARKTQIGRIKKEFAALMAFLLIFIGVHAYRAYFVSFAQSIDTQNAFAADLVDIGLYINTLPQETKKIVVVDTQDVIIRGAPAPAQTPMFISDTFGEEKRVAKNVTYVKSMDEIQLLPKDKVAVIPINTNTLKELKKRFPGLRVKLQDGFVSLEN